ncbi:MAG: hypothetical protein NWF11_01240 [Candidatus Bathyarchaeota archaeon]|nr:hypothetical protein [Candidatus Bathyarchaeota archaeon]
MRRAFIISLTIVTILMLLVTSTPIAYSAQGPREEDLQIYFYSNITKAYTALEAAEVDLVAGEGWSDSLISSELVDSGGFVQEPLYLAAIANPDIVLAPVDTMNMYQFDLNCNWSIPAYSSIRSPVSYQSFRQAIAHLVNKSYIVGAFCGGLTESIDYPASAQNKPWMSGISYPYNYNPATAATILNSDLRAQFPEGSTENPYYDSMFPGSARFIRTYPSGHVNAGLDLDPLEVVIRIDDLRRREAGRLLCDNLRKHGIPVNQLEGDMDYVIDKVFGLRDYHIYTGAFTTGKFPTHVYPLYHSNYWQPYGHNYVTGVDDAGLPNFPSLDILLELFYYSPNFSTSKAWFRSAMINFTEQCPTIPLWSDISYAAYSRDLLGVVNMDCYGPVNPYTFMHAYKLDGSPLRLGLIKPPNSLNIMYASWMYDYTLLDRINTYGSIDASPYNILTDQPGFILDWTTETWNDLGTDKTKVTKELRKDNYFVDTNGDKLANVDADAYLFSNYICYALGVDSWHWDTVKDIKRFSKLSNYVVEIYYDAKSYWLYTSASPPLVPFSVWLNTGYGLTQNLADTFVVNANLTTPGFLDLKDPVWINSISSNLDGTLTEWVDFHWELGDWYIDTPLTPGATVTADYYAIDDASGYTLGGNLWEDVTVGCGMYYMTNSSAGVGGFITAKKNPFYWMETPALAEIDFVWESGGYYEVTIFDVVKAAGAYDSQGTAVPDINWFPGADLAAPGGVINIFDIVTIAVHYGSLYSEPPP